MKQQEQLPNHQQQRWVGGEGGGRGGGGGGMKITVIVRYVATGIFLLGFCTIPLYVFMNYLPTTSVSTASLMSKTKASTTPSSTTTTTTTTTNKHRNSQYEKFIDIATTSTAQTTSTTSSASAANSATGTLFKGDKIRTYEGKRYYDGSGSSLSPTSTSTSTLSSTTAGSAPIDNNSKEKKKQQPYCTKWNVVTTIFEPSEAVRRATLLAKNKENGNTDYWCTVIVADTKTPIDYMDTLYSMNNKRKGYGNGNGKEGDDDTTNATTSTNNYKTRVIFLSVEDQIEWMEREQNKSNTRKSSAVSRFLTVIPFRSFARKNIGYLYAIQHGATILFDFDDDNLLPFMDSATLKKKENETAVIVEDAVVLPPIYNTTHLMGTGRVVTGPIALNHHALMGASSISFSSTTIHLSSSWPRGFPLTEIHNKATQGRILYENTGGSSISLQDQVGVLQFVADQNPDVDALHRLIIGTPSQRQPMKFQRHIKYAATDSRRSEKKRRRISTQGSLIVPSHTFVPYNAQATIHTHKALWALLLPITVKGRVSDIWRSYFSQRLFRDIDTTTTSNGNGSGNSNGLKVVILPPDIIQDRNEHSLIADMQAEEDLYYKTEALLQFLNTWDCNDTDDTNDNNNNRIQSHMEALWIELYERNYIELQDVTMVQLWLAALDEIGYIFPPLQSPQHQRIQDVVLMGQFNFGNYHIPNPPISTNFFSFSNEKDDTTGIDDNSIYIDERVVTDLLFWYQKWKQQFHHVQIRGPFPSQLITEMRNKHYVDIYPTKKELFYDRGLVSPMDNMLSTLQQYYDKNENTTITTNNNPNTTTKIKGVLYVHDDMLVNITNVFFGQDDASHLSNDRNMKETTIIATSANRQIHTGLNFRIHTNNGSKETKATTTTTTTYFTKPNNGLFRTHNSSELVNSLPKWEWNQLCVNGMINVTKDERSYQFMERRDNEENEEKNHDALYPYFTVPYNTPRQSDFLYIPLRLTKEYAEIAQLLIDHHIFLECGFPKIIDVLLLNNNKKQSSSSSSSSKENHQIRTRKKDNNDDNNKTKKNMTYMTTTTTTTGDDEDDDDDNNDRKTFVVQFKKVKLCTSWDYGSTRGSLAMIEQCATDAKPTSTSTSTSSLQFTPYSTIHPFKMTTHGYEIWDRTFDYVTTGTSNIESKVV